MSTPAQLDSASKCYCFNDDQFRRVVTYLLDQINASGGGGGNVQDMQVAWTPTNVKLGQEMGFVADPNFSGNPTLPGITTLTFNQSTQRAAFDIENAADVTAISFPNLTTIDPTNTQGGYLSMLSNPALTSISAPVLTNCGSGLNIGGNGALTSIAMPLLAVSLLDVVVNTNTSLTSVSFPSLTTIGRDLTAISNTLLTSFSLPLLTTVSGSINVTSNAALVSVDISSLVPTSGKNVLANGNAFNAATVNLFLHRCVLQAGWGAAGEILDLSGGTSAAPSGAGVGDKATLIGRGANVNTN